MITQLILSSKSKSIVTASYVLVGGGGGATVGGSNGMGGDVINAQSILLPGTYQILVGSGGSRSGGNVGPVGSIGTSSSFNGLAANGSIRTTTLSINGETFSGVDGGSGISNIAGSGALASSIYAAGDFYCYAGDGSTQFWCDRRGGSWTNLQRGHGNNGVVIITIPLDVISQITATGPVISTNGTNSIYRFNSSGFLTIL